MPAAIPTRSADCNCFAVHSTAKHVTQLYDQTLASCGLRTTQYSILAKLSRMGSLTISALAKQMVMDRTTLGRNIRPLERDGWIKVERTLSDRRTTELHLTAAGEKRLQAAHRKWSRAQEDSRALSRVVLLACAASRWRVGPCRGCSRDVDPIEHSRLPQGRMLSPRAYRNLGRLPRLLDLPVRRPPYLEAAVTAAVFIFLAYLVLGGA
jgi:DNA-binding MarR family transcriptional regulator